HIVDQKKITINMHDLKKQLYLCLISVNVLEAIRFYVSFACSFAFAEQKLMEGNAKIIKLIARDEALHLTGTQHILNILYNSSNNENMQDVILECNQEALKIFFSAAQQEKKWAEYLFQNGSILGLNKEILCQYIEYITNVRMTSIGLKRIFKKQSNPIPWINAWLTSDHIQNAAQEIENSAYLVGQINSEVSDDEFKHFQL
ncbi:MAG: ribonucleotide-diphosphate reductase subunit beta, partial [Buchnera aphidicola]|nr:ribonucleotide-diphosphate reductase subunit beta [Buchnera aphidicola]